jgi:hypothetical protein
LQVGALVLDLSFCRVGVLTRPLRQPLSTFNYLLPQKLLSQLQASNDTICPEMALNKKADSGGLQKSN